jgi:mRNA interferase HigB
VWIVSHKRLSEFWETRKEDSQQAEHDLNAWYKIAKGAIWKDFGSLRQTFGSADQVGNCVVFDVGNNRYRLIGRVFYQSGKLYVLRVMDHQEYDKDNWRRQCGCDNPQPKRRNESQQTKLSERKKRR